jgi:hypothetical protein
MHDMKRRLWAMAAGLLLAAGLAPQAHAADYRFDSTISNAVLKNYLNRAVHYTELLHYDINQAADRHGGNPRDNIRAILNMGAKYVGRSIMIWGGEENLSQFTPWLANAKRMIDTMHSVDPDIIFEAAEFEIVDNQVNVLDIPAQVFQAFGQPVTARKFNMSAIVYTDGKPRGGLNNVPDMSRLEARMWFYFLACNYIDIGVEAFHFGQVGLMDQNDPGHANWVEMLTKVREYGRRHARRHLVLINAHTPPSQNFVVGGKTMFDFNAFPLRIAQSGTTCCKGELRIGYADALWGKSKGGTTPSGWSSDHLPWLAEFDNFGGSNAGHSSNAPFVWGYDEISFIAIMSETDRNAWLKYAHDWIAANDTSAHLIMPGSRVVTRGPASSPNWYWSNTKSAACPKGFNAEETIKAIWGPLGSPVVRPLRPRTQLRGFEGLPVYTVDGQRLKLLPETPVKVIFAPWTP